jgi:hypothetical protein
MLTRESQPFSADLANNPAKFAEVVRAYAPGAVVAASLAPIALTGAGQLATWFANDGFIPGQRTGFWICWALAFFAPVLLFGTRARLIRPGVRRLPALYWVQCVVQNAWLSLLTWYVTPAYLPVLFFVLCLVLFTDVSTFYHATALKVLYSSMWLSQVFILLLIDLAGEQGLLGSLRSEPHRAATTLIAEVCVGFLSMIIIQVVGKGQYERDRAFHNNAQLESALRAIKTERGVLARSCDFLLQGLTAGRFSHDVASPISVVAVEVARLREILTERGGDGVDARLERCLERIEDAAEQTQILTRSLARSLREPADPVSIRLSELVAQALEHAANTIERHELRVPAPKLELEDVEVVVSRDHAAAIGNVLANGMLQSNDAPIEIASACANGHFCKLSIRDWGVTDEAQRRALTTVQAHMSLLADNPTLRISHYDGFGIGLLLTKALIVRWGGWLAAAVPEHGAGLRFDFVLPRVVPNSIPDELNSPERVLGIMN